MVRPVGAAVLAVGALATLGFAPFFMWPLGVVSVAFFMALVQRADGPWQAFGAGMVWGLGHHVTALHWLPMAFVMDADGDWVMGLLGGIPAWLVVAAYGALGVALVSAAAASVQPAWRVALCGLLWVLLEMLKAAGPLGFPWLPLGAMWAGNDVLIQSAANPVGVFGVSVLILLLGGVWFYMPMRRAAGACLALLMAVLVWGVWCLHTPEAQHMGGVMVRVVQPNITSPHKWDPLLREQFLQHTLDVAFGPQAGPAPVAVILPETAVAFNMRHDADLRARLAGLLRPGQTLVTGTFGMDDGPRSPLYFNEIAALDADGQLLGVHQKHVLVPFGEYIPGRAWLERLPLPTPLRTLSQSRLDFSAGARAPLLPTAAGPALGLVCYEGIFPWFVWRHGREAAWLVNVTNDNWFNQTIALSQHAALARLRAVEMRKPLVRVANTGLTVVWDAFGRVVGQLPEGVPAHADVLLRLP